VTNGIDIELNQGAAMSGTITNGALPEAGLTIALEADGQFPILTTTGPDGSYAFAGPTHACSCITAAARGGRRRPSPPRTVRRSRAAQRSAAP
jgi:hypothetical protein